jgi:DNA helicase-2/ATP-dependent DNA helicase PcrA
MREDYQPPNDISFDGDDIQPESESMPEVLKNMEGYEGLNDKQYLAATASLDANIRLLAPPGSGKTHTIRHRVKFLVENGVNPDNILVVTFSKAMADDMSVKISELVPFANTDQISTIHAFCYRLLRNWYNTPYNGWNYPKESWKVKSILEDLIAIEWENEDKPNYDEVLSWIDTAKYHNQFNQDYFVERLGYRGHWLWSIASGFQETMQAGKEMLFSDMLMYTEQLLESDSRFRAWCHNKFQYVIIDEAQDTNYQAMRILLSITQNIKP